MWRVLPLCRRGEVERARELVDQNADILDSGNADFAAGIRVLSASVLAAEGRDEEAFAFALDGGSRAVDAGDAWWIPFNTLDVAARLADLELAAQLLSTVDTGNWQPSPGVSAQRARVRARLSGYDPVAELGTAERLFRQLEMPFFVAAVGLERAEHLLSEGRRDVAAGLLAEARKEFTRLGAVPWLERVDAALGQQQAVTA
jgi:hypothetical protein